MFTIDELERVLGRPEFQSDFSAVKQSLVNHRIAQPILLPQGASGRLTHFVEAVLSSAPDWGESERQELCRSAAEIAETVAINLPEGGLSCRARRRAAFLYELANLPALAAAAIRDDDMPDRILSFFRRSGIFSYLNGQKSDHSVSSVEEYTLGEMALLDDVNSYGQAAQQDFPDKMSAIHDTSISASAWKIATGYDLGLSSSELRAFSCAVDQRVERSTVRIVRPELMQPLRSMGFPVELLPAQRAAIECGLLDQNVPAWGFASPTGSGKTFLARLLIVDLLIPSPQVKVVYLVPSKALVAEVAGDLSKTLTPLGFTTLAMSAQLVDLDERERTELDDASVVVMTPEKADMLLRLGAEFLQEVGLAIIDEAHHIESGTRGALLELYLWRLKRMLPKSCRCVFLSAVAPNIIDITRWLDSRGQADVFPHRATRMRVGVYKLSGTGIRTSGTIQYADGTSVVVVSERAERGIRKGICQVAQVLSSAGPVLIVAKGKKECENIAKELQSWLKDAGADKQLSAEELESSTYKALDANLEREMYEGVELRGLVRSRIAYHHAGLPPNVRHGVEKAIRERLIDYVFATTTLAEGVNFPFSSVIVQSLALREPPEAGRPSRYSPVTPRTFWNIAGRAGRPGFDAEGQVILFEPSLGLDRINAVIEPYLNPGLMNMAPVKSALASALHEIQQDLNEGSYREDHLADVELPAGMSKQARGAINLMRVGVVHARASGLIKSPEEILDSSFALSFLSNDEAEFARRVFHAQGEAMDRYVAEGDAPSLEELAELGLSLETLTALRDYVRGLQDWQIDSCAKLFFGGKIRLDQVPYIIGPVAKRMSELEGPALGGFLSDVIVKWLSGVTFASIRAQTNFGRRLEDLIAIVYSRVQYLLPWGLWATDWLVSKEAERRGIDYDNQIKNLAYLADAGVPNFDALNLVHMGIERVDATRLSRAYSAAGGLNTSLECVAWVLSQTDELLESILRGVDRRRLEYNFFDKLKSFRKRSVNK